MTLGERLHSLRVQKGLSQEAIAAQLGVSRQSVSKWETDNSVPELDKLLALSELFHLSLDELIRGTPSSAEAPQAAPQPTATSQNAPAASSSGRKLAALILFCFAGVVWLLFAVLGEFFFGIILSLPFLLCGIICLCFSRHTGLWCAWCIYISVKLYLYYATGISWRLTLLTAIFTPSMNYLRLAFAWGLLLISLVMILVTALCCSRTPLSLTRKNLLCTLLGWILVILFCILPLPFPAALTKISHALWMLLLDTLKAAALTLLLTLTFRLLRALRLRRKQATS